MPYLHSDRVPEMTAFTQQTFIHSLGLAVRFPGDVQYFIQLAGGYYIARVRTESLQTGSICEISTALNADQEGVRKLHQCEKCFCCQMKLNVAWLTPNLNLF